MRRAFNDNFMHTGRWDGACRACRDVIERIYFNRYIRIDRCEQIGDYPNLPCALIVALLIDGSRRARFVAEAEGTAGDRLAGHRIAD